MISPFAAYALDKGVGVLGSVVSNLFNKRIAKNAYEKDVKLMQYQNQYNSPQEQMKRLKAAGLNPMLVYGGGNVTGNLTGNMPKYNQSPVEINTSGGSNGLQLFQQYVDTNIKKATEDKLLSGIETDKQLRHNAKILGEILGVKKAKDLIDLENLPVLSGYNIEMRRNLAEKSGVDVANTLKLGSLRDQELSNKKAQQGLIKAMLVEKGINIEMQTKLLNDLKNGIPANAPWYVRSIKSLLDTFGLGTKEELEDYLLDIMVP